MEVCMTKNVIKAVATILLAAMLGGCAVASAAPQKSSTGYNAVCVADNRGNEATPIAAEKSHWFEYASPSVFTKYTERENKITEGNIYVSASGNGETGDGSFDKPFATITRAKEHVAELKKSGKLPKGEFVVAIMAGEYNLSSGIKFTEEDSGTADTTIKYCAYGDGEVVISGTVNLSPEDFVPVGDDIRKILSEEAADKVLMLDLKKYGVSSETLALYTSGCYKQNMAREYSGTSCEFYMNGQNFVLAAYPNNYRMLEANTFLVSGAGVPAEIALDEDVLERIRGWSSLDGIWAECCLFYDDYRDSTSTVTFDLEAGKFTTDILDHLPDSWRTSVPKYYFYNVLDELDIPGEWYLDRENCILYMYPTGDMATADLRFLDDFTDNLITLENTNNLTFEGLTFAGSKQYGIGGEGVENINITCCEFFGQCKKAINIDKSYNSTISECYVHDTGYGGIYVQGGEKIPLKYGYNKIDNNLLERTSQLGRTFDFAICVHGQGNVISHNEIRNMSGTSLSTSGNNNIVEYNYVHDCTYLASDCGSFYNADSWTAGGDLIRYNIFANIGSDQFTPHAVYWDGIADQTAYGNLFVNIAGMAIMMNEVFHQTAYNNIIINTGDSWTVGSSQRLDWFYYGTPSMYHAPGGELWTRAQSTPVTSDHWKINFPILSQCIWDTEGLDYYNPHVPTAPAFRVVANNVVVDSKDLVMKYFAVHYTSVYDNAIYKSIDDVGFVDAANGDYRLKDDSPIWTLIDDFEEIPLEKIGRY